MHQDLDHGALVVVDIVYVKIGLTTGIQMKILGYSSVDVPQS